MQGCQRFCELKACQIHSKVIGVTIIQAYKRFGVRRTTAPTRASHAFKPLQSRVAHSVLRTPFSLSLSPPYTAARRTSQPRLLLSSCSSLRVLNSACAQRCQVCTCCSSCCNHCCLIAKDFECSKPLPHSIPWHWSRCSALPKG